MDRSTWKKFERRVAALFGTVRAPLSGSNGGVTGSDSLSDDLYIEVKMRKKHALWSLYDDTKKGAKKEGKIPGMAIGETGRKGALIVVHSDHLKDVDNLLREIAKNEHGTGDEEGIRWNEPGAGDDASGDGRRFAQPNPKDGG